MSSLEDLKEDELLPMAKKLKGSSGGEQQNRWEEMGPGAEDYYLDLCRSDRAEGKGFFHINFLPGERRVPSNPILHTAGRLGLQPKLRAQSSEPKRSWMCIEHSQGCRCIEQAKAQEETEARTVALDERLNRLIAELETAPEANSQTAVAGSPPPMASHLEDSPGFPTQLMENEDVLLMENEDSQV